MIDLVEQAAQGDREAFGALAAARVDQMYAVAVRILRDPHRAEDAVQTALLHAWRDLPTLRDRGRFDAWVRRLLVRACYDEAGRHRAFLTRVRWLDVEPTAADGSAAAADRDELERALRRVPLDQRAVLVLHYFLDLPLTEVARTLDIPAGTARSRLHYAHRSLRAAIEAGGRRAIDEGGTA